MKKLLTILWIIMLIITLIQIMTTYSWYKSEVEGDFSVDIAKWSVKVNEEEIVKLDGEVATFEMDSSDMGVIESEYVSRGFAPGAEGYFYINLDTTEAQVAVKYNIQIGEIKQFRIYPENFDKNEDELPEPRDLTTPFIFEVQGVEDTFYTDNVEEPLTEPPFISNTWVYKEKNSVLGVMPLTPSESDQRGCKDRVKVYFKWLPDAENQSIEDILKENNLSVSAMNFLRLIIPVHFTAYQYVGESVSDPNSISNEVIDNTIVDNTVTDGSETDNTVENITIYDLYNVINPQNIIQNR